MESSSTYLCTICQEEGVSNSASTWCPECVKWFCADCNKNHGSSKFTKLHEIISAQNYVLLPLSILKISNRCVEHQEDLIYFCSFHGTPFCIRCANEKHKECKKEMIHESLKDIKSSAAVLRREQELLEIKNKMEHLEIYLLERKTRIEDQKQECLEAVHRLRKSINDHLDILEGELTDEIAAENKKEKLKMVSLLSQTQAHTTKLSSLQNDLSKMTKFATNFQIFMGLQDIEKKTSETGKLIESLQKDCRYSETNLVLHISPVLESFTRDVTSIGKIVSRPNAESLNLHIERSDGAQCTIPLTNTLDKAMIKLVHKMHINKGEINSKLTGCTILPNGLCVLADFNNNRLLLYSGATGKENGVVKLSSSPYDVTFIKDDIVAVSVYDKKDKIILVDIIRKKEIKSFVIEGDIVSVDSNEEIIVIGLGREQSIVILDLDGTVVHRFSIPTKHLARASFLNGRVYYTNWKDNIVSCCNMAGGLRWTYQDDSLLQPIGIAVDKQNLIYVVYEKSNHVVVILPNGGKSKILLNRRDGLVMPYGIHVNKDGNLLLVCNANESLAFLYKLSNNL